MNSTEELAKVLKKKFINVLNQENVSPKSPNSSTSNKNVSWADFHEYSADSEQKKSIRSTPYPNPRKKMKVSNSTPKTLSFDDSDPDDDLPKDNSFTTSQDISKLFKPKSQGTKRKRPENVIASSEWMVTACNQIRPDKSNKRCNARNVPINSDSSNGNSSVDELVFSSVVDDNESEEENYKKRTVSQETDMSEDGSSKIIVYDKLAQIEFDISSSDESSDSYTEQIFKPKVLNLNKCQIIKPKAKRPIESNFTKNQNQTDNNLDENLIDRSYEKINNEISESVENVPPKSKIRFGKVVKSFINETYCILFLKHPVKVYFHGKLSVTVLHGAVEVLGHILYFDNKKETEIYSPRGHSYLCFETVEYRRNTAESLQNILAGYNMPTKQKKIYLSQLYEDDCVIAIRNLNNNVTNYLSSHVAQYLFPKPVQCEKKIEKKLHCLFEIDEPSWKTYNKDEEWADHVDTALSRLEKSGFSCTMICGGKSVGKSTLFRYMINSLLNHTEKVVCIDLDPGQAEFTIGGCLSVTILDKPIFGPNFSHLHTPVKSFFVGDVNVVNCIDRYIASVKELLIYCERNITKSYPWVVNCIGFSKSLGTDLTVSVIKLVNPSILIQINSNMKSRNYPATLTKEFVQDYIYSFPIIIPQMRVIYDTQVFNSVAEEKVEGEFQFEARHLREMCILSYFSQMVEGGKEITSVAPYGVKLSSIKLHDLGYSKENTPAVVNGNLVALCKINDVTIDNQTVFDCFGFGIVRGIDLDSGELYLLTPVPETELDNVNSLIRGNINLPPSLYMKTGRQGLVPYIVLGTQQGTSSIPKRSYRNLKTLLKKK